MVDVDVISAFAVCGGGALTGALLLRPEVAQDEAGQEAVALSRCAYALLGTSLVLPLLSTRPLPPAMQMLITGGTIGSTLLMAWALSALSGRVRARLPLVMSLLGVLLCTFAAGMAGSASTRALAWLVAWGLVLGSASMLAMGWRLLRTPRNVQEFVLGVVLAATLVTSLVRATWLWLPGPPPGDHLMALPAGMASAFGLVYGGLPILYTTLLLNIFNARLRSRLRAQLRPDALLARFGGEEFVVLAPVTDIAAAALVAERLREAVARADWPALLGPGRQVTASLGVTTWRPIETLEAALQRADEALYRAKDGGRNQVQVAA